MFLEALEQVNKIDKKHKTKTNFRLLYLQSFAMESVIKHYQKFSLSSTAIKEVLSKNNFQTKMQEVGYQLSIEGTGYAWVIWRYNGESIIDYARVWGSSKVMGQLKEVWLRTETTKAVMVNDKEEEFELLAHFYYEGDKVMKEVGYFMGAEWNVDTEAIEYDTKVIPVVLLDNTPLKLPDVFPAAYPLVAEMEKLYNKLPAEIEKTKILYAFNALINSTQTAKKFKENVIEGGEDTFEVTDPDNKIANSVAPISAGVATVQQLESSIGFLDSKVREMSFLFRDHGSDTRKNEYDLVIYNQKAYEYMDAKRKHIERQLQQLIDMLASILNVATATITLPLVDFEQQRVDNLKAIVDIKVAQAEQARGIAAKNKAEAESLAAGVSSANVNTNLNLTPPQKS